MVVFEVVIEIYLRGIYWVLFVCVLLDLRVKMVVVCFEGLYLGRRSKLVFKGGIMWIWFYARLVGVFGKCGISELFG